MFLELRREKEQKNTPSLSAWLVFVFLLLIIQGSLLWMDHQPMFFFGDSASYIWTAITGNPPTDRSFMYGYFIAMIAVATRSLVSLVIAQVFLICAASVVMAHLLIRYFLIRPWIAFTTALLTTLEPLQLLYTRYVMTETLALSVFVFYVWTSLHYLETLRIRWLVVIQLIATVMISVRFAFIPMVWICAFAIPLLTFPAIAAPARRTGIETTGRMVVHIVMSVLLLFLFTSAYKHIHGYLQHKPPAYSYESGYFAMGFVLPIMEPEDFDDRFLGEQVLNHLDFPVADRRARLSQHWMEGGAIPRLQKLEPDRMKSDAIARNAAFHAVIHKPFAFLQLGWHSFTDYFDPVYFNFCMEKDLGNRRLENEFHNLIKTRFHYSSDASSALELKTMTGRYFLLSAHWYRFLLFLPLVWVVLIASTTNADQKRKSLFLCLLSLIFIGVVLFLAELPEPRYLQGPAWLLIFAAGIGWNRLLSLRK